MRKVLVTGAAGFIGYHLSDKLLKSNNIVIGMDNVNSYYSPTLKTDRIRRLSDEPNFTFVKADIASAQEVSNVFAKYKPEIVVNLAAQAGVRYSITNPQAYIESNITGFFNILEACRNSEIVYGQSGKKVEHLIFASSSSVYGNQQKIPFSVSDNVDHPISLYAATKKSNELMAYTYSHLYGLPTTGLRFFTVYGPWGRPDMAYFHFTKQILEGNPIKVFNGGDMYRDFTYIDDIVQCIDSIAMQPVNRTQTAKVYNIGNNKPERLLRFIEVLEDSLTQVYGRRIVAEKEFYPMQPGDVYQTYADVDDLIRDFGFKPQTPIEEGLLRFTQWYRMYYND